MPFIEWYFKHPYGPSRFENKLEVFKINDWLLSVKTNESLNLSTF